MEMHHVCVKFQSGGALCGAADGRGCWRREQSVRSGEAKQIGSATKRSARVFGFLSRLIPVSRESAGSQSGASAIQHLHAPFRSVR